MRFEKSPPSLIALFDEVCPGPPVERRKMFGYPCAFVRGQMFCGLFASSMIVRLAEGDRSALLHEEGAEVFDPMGGRPMKEYVVFPPSMLDEPREVRRWLERGLAFASSLPPKAKKAAKVSPKKRVKARS